MFSKYFPVKIHRKCPAEILFITTVGLYFDMLYSKYPNMNYQQGVFPASRTQGKEPLLAGNRGRLYM